MRSAVDCNIMKDLAVTIDFTDETKALNAETLNGYKMLIVFRDGMIWPDGYPDESTNAGWVSGGKVKLVSEPPVPPSPAKSQYWMKPEQGKAVRKFVEDGGTAFFLHNTTHVGLSDPDFPHVLGGAYTGHPPIRTFQLQITNSNHPITKGIHAFSVTHEHPAMV